jgi:hypothetical protein
LARNKWNIPSRLVAQRCTQPNSGCHGSKILKKCRWRPIIINNF